MSFQYEERIATGNLAYLSGLWIKPQGVFLHSLGCPGMTAEQAAESMNSGVDSTRMGVHAVIDQNKVIVTLPIDPLTQESMINVHGGLASNTTHIGIEMTEPESIRYTGSLLWTDLNTNKTFEHIQNNYTTAVEYVAQLCQIFKWDVNNPMTIMTHKSGYEAGIATAHGDPEYIWDKLGFSLNKFKKDVQRLM